MEITFLKAAIPLTKTFTKTPNGIEKSSYPNTYEFTSIVEQCTTLQQFASLLKKHAALGHCLLKGNLSRKLINESRAGTTDPNALTFWACLDVDGSKIATPDEYMKVIGLGDVSYITQYSASYKITDKLLRCHIFVFLTQEQVAAVLKLHLISLNFSVPELSSALALTKTNTALRYSLDITTCQNDKLIYIANPICNGFKPQAIERIVYVKKKNATCSFGKQPSIMLLKAEIEKRIKELREKAKLPERKNTYKLIKNTEILIKPDQGIITGIKEERGFVYFNLNGGDSWGYYHPANNPEFIFNFKGEPSYLTKELLPEYWQQVSSHPVAVAPTVKGTTFLAFLHKRSSSYFRGTYDAVLDLLDIYAAKNETQVRHFAAQSGFALPEFIPEWEMSFEPHAPYRVDVANQKINTFQPTEYMKNKGPDKGPKSFPTIYKVMHHALGSDKAITDYFINWVAYIVQTLSSTRTAWILHGNTGTGKGLLMSRILAPLFGYAQVAMKRMEELTEPYNGFLERCIITFIDEVQTSTLRNEKGILAKIKNFITEPIISIRNMYQNPYPANNHSNWIFASNMPDPVAVDQNDRRFNVAAYQKEKLVISVAEIEHIGLELQTFFNHLAAYPVDFAKASSPLDTADRRNLISISEASIDTVARALIEGDMEFFMDHLPQNAIMNNITMDIVENYKQVLIRIIDRCTSNDTQECTVSRDEIHSIFEHTVGDMPKSPNKFTSRLKHHRIQTERLRVEGIVMYGIHVKWKEIDPTWKPRLQGKTAIAAVATPIKKKK